LKKTHILAIIVIAVAIGAIMTTVSDSSTYSNFSEAIENPGKEYHVVGQLNKEAAMNYDPEVDANLFAFNMIDNKGAEQRVHFAGSEQIVLVGKYENDTFQASKILMKCPSKYNEGQEGEMQEFTAKTASS
jgi:cytochrome c-type biogenesis protein CcmE